MVGSRRETTKLGGGGEENEARGVELKKQKGKRDIEGALKEDKMKGVEEDGGGEVDKKRNEI